MFTGKLKDLQALSPYVNGNVAKALELIKDIDFTKYEDGKYPLDGENIFASINTYATEPRNMRRWEKHDQYIDIQIIGRGTEDIGYCDYELSYPETENRLAKDDVAFYEVPEEQNFVTLQQGDFALLFPWELHKPNCQRGRIPSTVQKIVIKVKKA